MKPLKRVVIFTALLACALGAKADAVDALREFVRDVKSGAAQFSQTVTSPDGKRKKTSTGSFEFKRPNQFRFSYVKPFEQLILGDGNKVWIFDPDLNQASSRRMGEALSSTPAALLAGAKLERDFVLTPLPTDAGLEWVQAQPRQADSMLQSLKIGFKGRELAALEIVDGFGQRSRLDFSEVRSNITLAAERFRFVLPAGADLIEQ